MTMTTQPSDKTRAGRYYEDFTLGERLVHATPRTITSGDAALYLALYGSRFAVTSATTVARELGLDGLPIDPLLVFHVVFGKSVPDVSLNAVANLGYAGCRFGAVVYPGDTLTATSEVIGLKPNSSGTSGNVYVRTTGTNQRGETVLELTRWVMVHRRTQATMPEAVIPELPGAVDAADLAVPLDVPADYDLDIAGSPHRWGDYRVGERIDHVDGMTVEEADHMLATRLYQNTARVHFDEHAQARTSIGRRLVYGGHVISMARALSFNGLGNAQWVAAINGGTHANPTFAGDTIYAWSEVLERIELPGRTDIGALRTRLVAVKNRTAADFPLRTEDGRYAPDVVLDLDLTVLVPR